MSAEALDMRHAAPDEGAAFWDSRLRSPLCTEEDRAAFTAWREADPANAAAFERLQAGVAALHEAFNASAELRAMNDRALELKAEPRWGRMAAGVAAAVTLGLGGWWAASVPLGPEPLPTNAMQVASGQGASIYQTGVGERSTVTLADGSKVTLNTRSRVEVSYTADQRSLRLISGQALFEVAKNKDRPFVVAAGPRQVTALGTAFDIRLDGEKVQVTLIEGRVKVAPTRPTLLQKVAATERELTPGQQLVATADSFGGEVQRADTAAATRWREGKVVFADTPLTEAVAEMNRYLPEPILIGDPALQRFSVNGMFLTNQPMSFVGAVTAYFPVEARARPDGATVLVPRG
ncbi:MAG TPA: FecR family protein [Caulobacteraceae bacterium]|nr:FecR family protein [Caulobacteraceae bacterium]